MNDKITCLELFSGAGGLATGIGMCGAQHKGFIEWNSDACATLKFNYGNDLVRHIDVRKVNFRDYGYTDLIAGGPPCQPFSLGGKHGGFRDDRDMFPQAARAIAECQPKAFIFENVKGLLRESFSTYFSYIILRLTYPTVESKIDEKWEDHLSRLEKQHTAGNHVDLKYNVVFRLLDAADYGIPQRRERVVIVGIRSDLNLEWSFPAQTHSLEALLWTQFIDKSYLSSHGMKAAPQLESYDMRSRSVIDRLKSNSELFPPSLKPWRTVRDQIGHIPFPDKQGTFHPEHVLKTGAKVYAGHTGSFIDLPSKTVKAGDHGVPGGENMIRYEDGSVRYYTTFEAKRIQTFPSEYRILGSWTESLRQIGNAVPVDLGEIVAKSVINLVWQNTNKKPNKAVDSTRYRA
jgi:DNA (cytosine-5)-methyltransferase 1